MSLPSPLCLPLSLTSTTPPPPIPHPRSLYAAPLPPYRRPTFTLPHMGRRDASPPRLCPDVWPRRRGGDTQRSGDVVCPRFPEFLLSSTYLGLGLPPRRWDPRTPWGISPPADGLGGLVDRFAVLGRTGPRRKGRYFPLSGGRPKELVCLERGKPVR